MNSRQRFLATITGQQPDQPPLFPEGIRDDVLAAWSDQGLPGGADLDVLFHYDSLEQLDPEVYPIPEITNWSDPDILLPLLRQRLDPNDPRRLPENWDVQVNNWKDRTYPLFMRIHPGLFLSLGIEDWRSFAPAVLRLVRQPEIVHQILEIQASFAARLAEQVLSQVDVDGVIFSEPIAGNHGPLVSPAMYRRFALHSYERIFPVLQKHAVPALIWRSYANPASLIPQVLQYPFNALWLCETPPGALSPALLRSIVGQDITLIGGIDSHVLHDDRQSIRQAVEALKPFVTSGRFIPLADGRVRADVPYSNYLFFRQELNRVFGVN